MNVLGIDPGFGKKSTGLAIVDTRFSNRVIYTETCDGLEAIARINKLVRDWTHHVALYAVVQSPLFQDGKKTPRWNTSAIALVKNAAISHEIIGFLKGLGINVQVRQPTRGAGMKMSPEMFVKEFGGKVVKLRTKFTVMLDGKIVDEHARDAVALAMSWRAKTHE